VRIHNTLKEVSKTQFMQLLAPERDLNHQSGSLVLRAGSDLQLEDFRLDPHLGVVFQAVYTIGLETMEKVYSEKFSLAEFLYLPIIDPNQ
jgi:hypothetical protein